MNKYFCDRCGIELKKPLSLDDFESFFESFSDKKRSKISLCKKCQKGFDKIIKNYLEEVSK